MQFGYFKNNEEKEEKMYWTITFAHWGILVVCLIGLILIESGSAILNWICDKDDQPAFFEKFWNFFKNIDEFLAALFISLIVIPSWPIAYPGLLLFGIIYFARYLLRLEKKLDGLTEDKNS